MKARYERIGVTEHWAKQADFWERRVQRFDPTAVNRELLGGNYETHLNGLISIAFGNYLNDALPAARQWGAELIRKADTYFFGEWRLAVLGRDAEYWRSGNGDWIPAYRSAVAFAVAMGDWDSAKRLSAHPSENKIGDPDDKTWYLLVAEFLMHGRTARFSSIGDQIQQEGKKYHQVLAQLLDAVARGQAEGTGELFGEHMEYYQRRLKPRDEIDHKLAIDGTIIAHAAEHAGCPIVFDEKWKDYLIYV